MKDIKAILEGVELEDAARARIIEEVGENYRTINEVTGKARKIEELEKANGELTEQIETLSEQVKGLEGDNEQITELQGRVAEFEKAEQDRKAEEEEARRRKEFEAVFDAAVGDKEFANDIMRESIFNKVYKACSATTGASAEAVLSETVKDMDGVWKNPQRDINNMPAAGNDGDGTEKPIRSLDDVKGMSAADINRNWDSVSKLLGRQKG